ncbi:MAG TPA: hypothetical protein VMW64_03845 [Dehalococcoidia bacterium]|nr:hypothetical protein [Dehalococcoidia bacterium]
MEPARELNRALSQLSLILELSGNPIAVLENIENSQDIAVQPGAVWEIPERAKAYLLDLLQGGGVKLHVDYIDLLYRTIHDLSESPRTAFGDNARRPLRRGAGDGASPVAAESEPEAHYQDFSLQTAQRDDIEGNGEDGRREFRQLSLPHHIGACITTGQGQAGS